MEEIKTKAMLIATPILVFLFGNIDILLQTLILFMAFDYITGLLVAGVFKKSLKSENGGLASDVGLKGIVRKGIMLGIVFIGYRLDLIAGTNIVRNSIISAFIVNEVISINENAVLMGVDIPKILTDTIKNMKN